MGAIVTASCAALGLAAGAPLGAMAARAARDRDGPHGAALRTVVPVATGVAFALTAARFGTSWTLPGELAFVGALVALAASDIETYLLPVRILYPAAALTAAGLALAAGVTSRWGRFGVALACGIGAASLLFAIHAFRREWMGFGDVRLAGLVGLGLGWVSPLDVLVGLVLANLAGTLVGVALMAAGRAGWRTRLPYGAFLALGAIAALVVPVGAGL
ncbi:MAG: prepilin peptidase [Acidimicrobiales bacterium]